MKYKPHNYQAFASEFILEHPVCCLMLDMGLGKTVITLTALWELVLDRFDVSRILVIAPKRVAEDTWPKEIAKWEHLSGLSFSLVLGSRADREAALRKRAFIYIINRENVAWLVENYRWDFDMVVIDELSSFKSNKAERFKAMKRVRPKVSRIIGLTGTPAPNSLLDLWPQMAGSSAVSVTGSLCRTSVTGKSSTATNPEMVRRIRFTVWCPISAFP